MCGVIGIVAKGPVNQALYDALGFVKVSDEPQELWDGVRPLIRMDLAL